MVIKKMYLGFALIAGVLSGCADDDITSSASNGNGACISYNVSLVGNHTKGIGLTNTNVVDNLPNMQVWAYYHPNASGFGVTAGTQYVGNGNQGITVTNTSGVWKEDAANTAYWPAETAILNFQAIAPATHESIKSISNDKENDLAHMVANVTIPQENAKQVDILMANEDGVTQATHSRSVQLDFKHVLSQVRFKVQTASKQLSGDIGSISLCNIKSTGTVGYHAADDVADGTNAWKKVVLGSTVSDDVVASYPLGMAADCSFGASQFGPGNAKDVTAADGSLLMLPQTTTAWTTVDGTPISIASADGAKNSYMKISCKIKNGDTYLVGSPTAFGEVYIPFAANWVMGKKYVYTINIGTGTGGFDANGNPMILPIKYSVDIDEWYETTIASMPLAEESEVINNSSEIL